MKELNLRKSVSRALIEEIVVCIFDSGLSEDDAIEYMYNTLNNIGQDDENE